MGLSAENVPPVGEPVARDLIQMLRFTTDDLPPEDRYRAWYLRDWPRTQPIYRTEPIEPFNTSWVSTQLGPLMFVRVEITGMRWERRLNDIRASDFDPIIISLMKTGEAHGDFDGRAFHETPGTFHFHDLGRASLHISSASLTYNLVLPRVLAARWFGPLSDLHGMVVPADQAALVFALAEQVDGLLPSLDVDQAERLSRMFLEAIAVAWLRPFPSPSLGPTRARRFAGEPPNGSRRGWVRARSRRRICVRRWTCRASACSRPSNGTAACAPMSWDGG